MRTFLFLFSLLCWSCVASAQEICANGIDDDNDGLIDLNDTLDCHCAGAVGGSGEVSSIIPNPSFETLDCCPTELEMLSCADTWEQATYPTTDLFNDCGWFPQIMPLPLPDGHGCVGTFFADTWQEYVGACLLSPMLTGEDYTLRFNVASANVDNNVAAYELPQFSPTELVLYGLNSCATFPVPVYGCPESMGWQALATVPYQPQWTWEQIEMNFTPTFDVQAVMLGGPCQLPDGYYFSFYYAPYVFWDNLVLNASALFNSTIHMEGSFCAHNATLVAHPDTTAGSYQWFQEGVALVGRTDTILPLSANGLGVGTYQFMLSLDTSCTVASYTVTPELPTLPLATASDTLGCPPLTVDFSDVTAAEVDSCHWDFGDGSSVSGCDPSHTYSAPGLFSVTLSITTADGCSFDSTFAHLVHVIAPPTAEFDLPTPVIVGTPSVQLHDASSAGAVEWDWDLGDIDPFFANVPDPVITVPVLPGEYPITLVVTDAAGCVDTVEHALLVVPNGDLDMPNVFSPNGDGQNDRFIPLDEYPDKARLRVFNRWGQEIFTTSQITAGWSGAGVPGGTYYWIVEDLEPGRETNVRSGHVTLLR